MGDEIIKVINDLCEKFGVAIDWTSENVLPYLEQLAEKFISWEISTSIAWIIMMWVLTIASLTFAIIVYKFDSCDGIEWAPFICLLVVTILVTGMQVFDIIECKTFPEKAIYDYIQNHY